jgi:hypothetical protein
LFAVSPIGWAIDSASMDRIYRGNLTWSSLRGKRLFLSMDVFGIAIPDAPWHDYRKAV